MLAKPNPRVGASPKVIILPILKKIKLKLEFVDSLKGPWFLANTYNHTILIDNKRCNKHMQTKSRQLTKKWLQLF
jgi:hypothetical protein